jgi:hypothetical protein
MVKEPQLAQEQPIRCITGWGLIGLTPGLKPGLDEGQLPDMSLPAGQPTCLPESSCRTAADMDLFIHWAPLPQAWLSPDVIIVDPARAGLSGAVRSYLVASSARRVVYVSCNPATQVCGQHLGAYGQVALPSIRLCLCHHILPRHPGQLHNWLLFHL